MQSERLHAINIRHSLTRIEIKKKYRDTYRTENNKRYASLLNDIVHFAKLYYDHYLSELFFIQFLLQDSFMSSFSDTSLLAVMNSNITLNLPPSVTVSSAFFTTCI